LDENWETVKVEANQLMTDLQATYDDILHAFKEVLDRRRERRQQPPSALCGIIRGAAGGLGAITAFVIAAKSR
jgi:hypothetical protein